MLWKTHTFWTSSGIPEYTPRSVPHLVVTRGPSAKSSQTQETQKIWRVFILALNYQIVHQPYYNRNNRMTNQWTQTLGQYVSCSLCYNIKSLMHSLSLQHNNSYFHVACARCKWLLGSYVYQTLKPGYDKLTHHVKGIFSGKMFGFNITPEAIEGHIS